MFTKLRLFTLGVVGKDKEIDQTVIEVYPLEILPTEDGKLGETKKIDVSTTNYEGEKITVSAEKHKLVEAYWLALASGNRLSAPDVMKGETVLLYRYAGNDTLYWDTIIQEPDLRKKERAIFFFSNKDEIAEERTANVFDKGYSFVVDTYNKHIGLHTSNNDGEEVAWDIQIDTEQGNFMLKDSNNNGIIMQGKDGNMYINLNKDLEYTIGNDVKLTVGNDVKEEVGNNYTTEIGGDLKIDVTGNTEIKTTKFAVTNGSVELLSILSDLIQALSEEKHIGNMGAPTVLDPSCMAKYIELKVKLDMLKK